MNEDIIYTKYPFDKPSKRPRMSISDRAKIFAPFAALRGYEEEIDKQKKTNEYDVETQIESILLYDDLYEDTEE